MSEAKYNKEQILKILQQSEEEGISVVQLCQKYGVSRTSFYKWRAKYRPFANKLQKPRHSEEQILAILQQAKDGQPITSLCHEHGISQFTFYYWYRKHQKNIGVLLKPRHNEEQILKILQQAKNGQSITSLCHEHGISPFTFYRWCKKYQATIGTVLKPKITEGEILKILQQAKDGRSITSLCYEHNISQFTFYRWRKKYQANIKDPTKPKFDEEQILKILQQAKEGASVISLCHKYGMSAPTFYKWRKNYLHKLPSLR